MENLSLEELQLLENWYDGIASEWGASEDDKALVEKIKQAIADKEFEEKRLQF